MKLPNWARDWLKRWADGYRVRHPQPDWIIGGAENPYLKRWWVIPRNPVFNVYLHEFRRSDDDRALHDHPWVNCSIVLAGGYWEVLPANKRGKYRWRAPGSVTFRLPRAAHRVELSPDRIANMPPYPATTLFITGPRVREWGFWCPQGWVHWRVFTDPATSGTTTGRGCE